MPYKKEQNILIVGEGNFSWAASLVAKYFPEDASHITATCYDSEKVLHKKYPDAQDHVDTLLSANAKV